MNKGHFRMRPIAVLILALLALALSRPAAAELAEIRVARMDGLGYLQAYLMQDLGLVEKNARAQGLELTVRYIPLGQPTAINEAVLSGSAELGVCGITPFIILWDKTRNNIGIKAVAALNSQPAFLNTINPNVHSLRDFTEHDRIALPAVKVAYQATILQMAAEKEFGQYDKLDTLTVGLSHPDATNALLSGKTEITAHFTSPPFQYQQLADPKVHRVMSSYEVTGGPATFSGLFATTRFHDDNPKAFQAILRAVEEANVIIHDDPRRAAEIFVRLDNSKLSVDRVEQILKDPDIIYGVAPQNITKYTDFMARVGTISRRPATWQDLFFPEIHTLPGS